MCRIRTAIAVLTLPLLGGEASGLHRREHLTRIPKPPRAMTDNSLHVRARRRRETPAALAIARDPGWSDATFATGIASTAHSPEAEQLTKRIDVA